jgi:oxaloacetate decarboxylase beta subunit
MYSKTAEGRKILRYTLVMAISLIILGGSSLLFAEAPAEAPAPKQAAGRVAPEISLESFGSNIVETTGINSFINDAIVKETTEPDLVNGGFKTTTVFGWQELLMIGVGFVLIWLGAAKGFEPLLLIPIGFGTVLVNTPIAGMFDAPHGFLRVIFEMGIANEFFPLIIFMGIGALTDFGPLIANPKTAILGAAAQFGVFASMFGVAAFNLIPGINFDMFEACAIGIIGGADGPTTIYIANKLAPNLLATVAVAAYSYMSLVPIIQPPIMKLLTTDAERKIKMRQLRHVTKAEKIAFPLVVLGLCILLLPSAAPLIGCLTFGNFIRECGVVERLSKTLQNEMLNITSILLSLGVGSQMVPEGFLQPKSLTIIFLGLLAFAIATASGVLIAKLMNVFSKEKINPLIGSAGVSAVPMAARVSNKVGLDADPSNFLLMHAMGPNVAGVIGTAIAAGVMIAAYGG